MPTKAELKQKIEELKLEKKKALEESQVANDSQVAYKIVLNSVYGYIGTKYSPVFNKTIAEAVTKSGQHCTREMVGYTNNLLNDLIGSDRSNEWVVAGDTDSTISSTEIEVNDKTTTIEKAFLESKGHIEFLKNGTEVKILDESLFTPTINGKSNIKNISRHKVDKTLFEISIPGKHPLTITKDHSLIVYRNGELVECTPENLLPTDCLVVKRSNHYHENSIDLKEFDLIPVSSCIIESIGNTNDYVYDMEVEDNNHMFFANDVLVHNSLYVRIDNVLKKLFGTTDIDWYDEKTFEKIKTFVDTEVQTKLNQHIADFICETCYTDQRRIEFKREKISSEGDFLAKKRYALHARDNEGLPCDKFEYKGVDIAKNELTTAVKDMLQFMVENMMTYNWSQTKICEELQKMYEKFCKMDIEEIGYIKNLNKTKDGLSDKIMSIEDGSDDSEDGLELEKGAGVHARSARIYNSVLKNLHLDNMYEEIKQGDRMRYIYIKTANKYNVDCVGWKDKYPPEFRKIFEVDYDLMWEKIIISPLKKFLQNHKCITENIICQFSDKPIENEVGESLF